MPDDDFDGDALELARCAQINFQNFEKMSPFGAAHPIYKLAREQLDAAITRLENEDE